MALCNFSQREETRAELISRISMFSELIVIARAGGMREEDFFGGTGTVCLFFAAFA